MKGYRNTGLLLSVILLASCASGLKAAADNAIDKAEKNSQRVDLLKKGAFIAVGISAGAVGGYCLINGSKNIQLQNIDLGLQVANLTEQIAELTAKNEKLAAELAAKSGCLIL